MTKYISRRELLKAGALAGAGLLVGGWLLHGRRKAPRTLALEPSSAGSIYLPYLPKDPTPTATQTPTATPTPTPTRTPTPSDGAGVAHVHAQNATTWSQQTDYWDYVDQGVVNEMVDHGVMALTGAASVADAWRAILPAYQPGQGIAVKVNFNNSSASCSDSDGQIDALIHPVNAMMRGLAQIGVLESDLWVFDAIRRIPDHFVGGCLYPGVQFFDRASNGCRSPARYTSDDPNASVLFAPPAGIPQPAEERLPDTLIDATYLINVPILKVHGMAGVSLGFKNHFGTINRPALLHEYIDLRERYFSQDYSLLVDIFQNPHVGPKTVLTLGDGLFGCRTGGAVGRPTPWETFGDQAPNSLFFASDPVAVDCVMCDFLSAEVSVPADADVYLRLAGEAGLGEYERGDPWGSGYDQIDYLWLEL